MSRTKRCEVCGQKKLKVICITCVEKDMKNWEKRMVQKGKLEERERIEKIIDKFMKERTYIKSSDEGTNVSIIKFMPFELEQLQKEIHSQQNPTQSNGSMNNGLGTSSADTFSEFWDNPEDDRWDREEEKQDE